MNTLRRPDIVVRQATFEDAYTLAQLLGEMDEEVGIVADIDMQSMQVVLQGMASFRFFRAYLAFEENRPVASFSLMIFSSPAHQGAPQALLDAVVVTRDRRNQGIGEAMLQYAIEIARAAGCYKMMLSSNLKRVAAHRFYERMGFTQHGVSLALPLEARMQS